MLRCELMIVHILHNSVVLSLKRVIVGFALLLNWCLRKITHLDEYVFENYLFLLISINRIDVNLKRD